MGEPWREVESEEVYLPAKCRRPNNLGFFIWVLFGCQEIFYIHLFFIQISECLVQRTVMIIRWFWCIDLGVSENEWKDCMLYYNRKHWQFTEQIDSALCVYVCTWTSLDSKANSVNQRVNPEMLKVKSNMLHSLEQV